MKQLVIIILLSICSHVFSQQPVFATENGALYSIDLNNCSKRLVGIGVELVDIAFTPDGRLWGLSNGAIYRVDTSNASSTFIGQTLIGGVSLESLNDSVLLSEYEDSLWEININTLKTYNLGNIGYAAAGDLVWYDNDLYMSSHQLIRIVLNSTNTMILSSVPVDSFDNPIPECEGLATASFPGLENSIVGFCTRDYNAYKICPIDGSYQLLCPLMGEFAGAASIRLPTQDPLPTSCADILPVTLLNFTSTLINKTVKLLWQTAMEINSSYFLIERSADGLNFSTIGTITAADVNNNIKQYSFLDDGPLAVNYYRLKEVDLNGKYAYSNILSVKIPQTQVLNIIDNPVQNLLELQINTSSTQLNYVTILDFAGRKLKYFNMKNGVQNIDVSFLPTGNYILQLVTTDGEVYSIHFIKAL
jgi:hypothetical protein